MNSFVLAKDIADAIVAQAQAGVPEEVCGLIAGKEGSGTHHFPGRNVSRTPRVTFEMDAETIFRQVEFADQGLELVAIYHSHPRGPGGLSQEDLRWAELYPGVVQLLCSLAQKPPTLRAYWVSGGQAREVELITTERNGQP